MVETLKSENRPPRLDMRGIRKRYGATQALDGVDFSVRAGEIHALLGENGAGKSTLVKVLSGAIRPDLGSMALDGAPFSPCGPLDARRAGIAMIYQELSLAPHLSVEDNILLGMEPVRAGILDRTAMRRTTLDVLQRLGHAGLRPEMRVGLLPPAARQLVEIARALAVGCRVLVLDEPTSSLSREDARRLFDLMRALKSQGHALVFISHFIEEVCEVADRFTVLRDGHVAGSGLVAETPAAEIVRLMVGRQVASLYPRSERAPGEVLLELEGLTGAAKPVEAGLTLRRGEVLGIAGLVGAGRTELLRAVFGLDRVRKGLIRVGAWSGPASPVRRWQQGVGYLSEDRATEGLALRLSLADNITLSKLTGLGPLGCVLPSRQDAAAQRWIERLDVRCSGPGQLAGELSGGNQQKLALARLLYHDVDVLLLDEPTRGIDVTSKAQLYQMIDDLVRRRPDRQPRAVLLVSSYLPELIGVCDRIAVMCQGRLGPARPASDFDEHKLLLEVTGWKPAA